MEKPVLDEGAFQQLLAAAYVIQQQTDFLRLEQHTVSGWLAAKPSYEDALAIIAETQEQLRSGAWDADSAATLVAKVLRRITHATGVAVALERGGMLEYVCATGSASSLADVSLPTPPDLGPESADGEPGRGAAASLVRQIAGNENDIALPLTYDGRVAGVVEVHFERGSPVQENELRCCQLLAETLAETVARTAVFPAKSKTEKDHGLREGTALPAKPRRAERKGKGRAKASERPTVEREVEGQNVLPGPTGTQALAVQGSQLLSTASALSGDPERESQAISTMPLPQPQTEVWNPWISSVRARRWLEALQANGPARRWMDVHRSDLYLAGAVVILVLSIGWVVHSSQPSLVQSKNAQPTLTFFEKILVALDLAEPPTAPVYSGNPNTMVWVDVRTALYYCPGAELYGKTDGGKLTTQRDAQIDQFQPAERKSCN